MSVSIKVLMVEDSEDDAEFLLRELRHGDYSPECVRVDSPRTFREALKTQEWDIILSDYYLPGFSALTALQIVHDMNISIPFIVITGATGEDIAVEAMRAGAQDYLLKHNLRRLVSAIRRELLVARTKRNSHEQQTQISNELAVSYQILNSVAAPVVVFDHDEKIVQFNAECQKLTSLKEQDVLGTFPWEKIFSLEDPQWFKSILTEVKAGKFKPLEKDHVCKTADGTLITIPWIYKLVVDDNRKVKYLVATAKYLVNPQ
jgi:two-component system cell cycle sensor histidine kinase/response regulator CckA